MDCLLTGTILGHDSKLEYSPDSLSTLRGKFLGILLWNPIQGLGNLALRCYYLATATWADHGRMHATCDHYDAMKCDSSLRGRALSSNKVLSYQVIELAKEVSKLVLFVVFGIPLREIIALFGIAFPLDARVYYAHLERFLFVYPKDPITTEPHALEFFSFSAPCMQPDLPEMKTYGRRCDSCCAPEERIYHPNLTTVKLKLLRSEITRVRELCLNNDDHYNFFRRLHAHLLQEKKRTKVSLIQELRVLNGS